LLPKREFERQNNHEASKGARLIRPRADRCMDSTAVLSQTDTANKAGINTKAPARYS
jgi:hypothetical protein